jgi:hypothetical protein
VSSSSSSHFRVGKPSVSFLPDVAIAFSCLWARHWG